MIGLDSLLGEQRDSKEELEVTLGQQEQADVGRLSLFSLMEGSPLIERNGARRHLTNTNKCSDHCGPNCVHPVQKPFSAFSATCGYTLMTALSAAPFQLR